MSTIQKHEVTWARQVYIDELNAPLLRQLANLKSECDQAMRENDAYRAGRFEQAISFLQTRLYTY
jgi:hypothetical protein